MSWYGQWRNYNTGRKLKLICSLNKHFNTILDMSNKGRYLVSGSADQSLILWDIVNKSMVSQKINIHKGEIELVEFIDNGFISTGADKVLNIWNIN